MKATALCMPSSCTAVPPQRIQAFLEELHRVVERHPIVKHPFIERFRSGNWTRDQIRYWVSQQLYLSISLPSAFAALYARIPEKYWQEKSELVELINVEAWGTDRPDCHSQHFRQLLTFFNLNLAEITRTPPPKYSQDFTSIRLSLCLDSWRPLTHGLAAIALGNEYLNLFLYQAFQEGIKKVKGCTGVPLGYFEKHLQDEASDAAVFLKLFQNVVTSDTELLEAEAGLMELLNARCCYFDALYVDVDQHISR